MTMNKGLAVIEANDTETKAFYIDQDALEFARLNAKISKRTKAAEVEQKAASHGNRSAELAKARRKAYSVNAIGKILLNCAICGGVAWAGIAGMIHPIIYVPVSLFCLCVASMRLGAWFGRRK